ncbi:hypothetical protein FB459_2190 [Yimella lutea]|uniref:TrbL/VirB6 plasmid conjugal transfer protein n=1 Tax=Yimella lutea TaxID=587872 RepID=A0A542EH85_9MICO|nr:hypothetical protein [Yimella lutea]TQJ14691.1 hypothetical protein FB459_2190 [Yimella lutea]
MSSPTVALRTIAGWTSAFFAVFTLVFITIAATAPASLAAVSTTVDSSGQMVAISRPATSVESFAYSLNTAVPKDDDSGGGTFNVCEATGDAGMSQSDLLTVNRWGDSTSNLHTRLDADFWNDATSKIQRNSVDSSMLSIGNTMWSVAVNSVTLANNYCIADSIGTKIDRAAGNLAKIFWGDGRGGQVTLIAMLFLAGLATVVVKLRQGGQAFSRALIRPILTIAAFGIMMNGALASSAGVYGTMSPGWLVSRASAVISSVSSTMTAPMIYQTIGNNFGEPAARTDASTNRASCINYLSVLRQKYNTASPVGESGAAVPLAMDSMWQLSGLSSYVRTQYGTNNVYGWASFCRGLDLQAGTRYAYQPNTNNTYDMASIGSLEGMTRIPSGAAGRSMNLPAPKKEAQVWSAANNTQRDETMIWAAACKYQGGWKVQRGWNAIENKHTDDKKLTDKQCSDYWNAKGSPEDMFFNWQDDADAVHAGTSKVSDADIAAGYNPRDYLNVLHGTSTGAASTAAMAYAFFSIFNMLVFVLLAGVIFVLKTLLLATGLFVFFVALVDMVPGQNRGSQLAKYAKSTLGFILVAFGYNFLLAVMIALTGFILEIGTAMGLAGMPQIIWTGAAPLIAIIAMKLIWKKAMSGVPDPFSFAGAKAYTSSAASGMVGGMVGGSIAGMMSRGRDFTRRSGSGGGAPIPGGAGPGGTGGDLGAIGQSSPGTEREGGQSPLADGSAGADGETAAGGVSLAKGEKNPDGSALAATGVAGAAGAASIAAMRGRRGSAGGGTVGGLTSGGYNYSRVGNKHDRRAMRHAARTGAAQRRAWYAAQAGNTRPRQAATWLNRKGDSGAALVGAGASKFATSQRGQALRKSRLGRGATATVAGAGATGAAAGRLAGAPKRWMGAKASALGSGLAATPAGMYAGAVARKASQTGAVQRWRGKAADARANTTQFAKGYAAVKRRDAWNALRNSPIRSTVGNRGAWAAAGTAAAGVAAVSAMPAAFALAGVAGTVVAARTVSGKQRDIRASRRAQNNREKMAYFAEMQKQNAARAKAETAAKAAVGGVASTATAPRTDDLADVQSPVTDATASSAPDRTTATSGTPDHLNALSGAAGQEPAVGTDGSIRPIDGAQFAGDGGSTPVGADTAGAPQPADAAAPVGADVSAAGDGATPVDSRERSRSVLQDRINERLGADSAGSGYAGAAGPAADRSDGQVPAYSAVTTDAANTSTSADTPLTTGDTAYRSPIAQNSDGGSVPSSATSAAAGFAAGAVTRATGSAPTAGADVRPTAANVPTGGSASSAPTSDRTDGASPDGDGPTPGNAGPEAGPSSNGPSGNGGGGTPAPTQPRTPSGGAAANTPAPATFDQGSAQDGQSAPAPSSGRTGGVPTPGNAGGGSLATSAAAGFAAGAVTRATGSAPTAGADVRPTAANVPTGGSTSSAPTSDRTDGASPDGDGPTPGNAGPEAGPSSNGPSGNGGGGTPAPTQPRTPSGGAAANTPAPATFDQGSAQGQDAPRNSPQSAPIDTGNGQDWSNAAAGAGAVGLAAHGRPQSHAAPAPDSRPAPTTGGGSQSQPGPVQPQQPSNRDQTQRPMDTGNRPAPSNATSPSLTPAPSNRDQAQRPATSTSAPESTQEDRQAPSAPAPVQESRPAPSNTPQSQPGPAKPRQPSNRDQTQQPVDTGNRPASSNATQPAPAPTPVQEDRQTPPSGGGSQAQPAPAPSSRDQTRRPASPAPSNAAPAPIQQSRPANSNPSVANGGGPDRSARVEARSEQQSRPAERSASGRAQSTPAPTSAPTSAPTTDQPSTRRETRRAASTEAPSVEREAPPSVERESPVPSSRRELRDRLRRFGGRGE